MSFKYYIAKFSNGIKVFAKAFSIKDAETLAKAKMIKQGLSYDMEYIVDATIKQQNNADFVA